MTNGWIFWCGMYGKWCGMYGVWCGMVNGVV